MVGYCLTGMPGTSTGVTYGPMSDGTATMPPTSWDYVITVTSTSTYDYRRDKEEEERVKAELKAKQVAKMRSLWKDSARAHQFKQPKWSHSKSRRRGCENSGG